MFGGDIFSVEILRFHGNMALVSRGGNYQSRSRSVSLLSGVCHMRKILVSRLSRSVGSVSVNSRDRQFLSSSPLTCARLLLVQEMFGTWETHPNSE